MARQDKIEFGTCRICGLHKRLTEEHIPPKSAFNSGTVKVYSADEALKTITDKRRLPWDFSGLKYKERQGGYRLYTLCSKCNSYTGGNYVNYYQQVAKEFSGFLNLINFQELKGIKICFEKLRPLPFFKQILTMFASITNICKDDDIKQFILNKEKVGLNTKRYRVFMSIFKGGIPRKSGWSILGTNVGNFKVAEIVAFPFIFVLLGNAEDNEDLYLKRFGADISFFSNYNYEEEKDIDFLLPCNECNINFPCDYRRKEDFIKMREKI